MTDKSTLNKTTADMTARAMNLVEDAIDQTQGTSNTDKLLIRYAVTRHMQTVAKSLFDKAKRDMMNGVDTNKLDKMRETVITNKIGEKGPVYTSTGYTLQAKINKPPAKVNMTHLESKCRKIMTQKQWDEALRAATEPGTPATTLEVESR